MPESWLASGQSLSARPVLIRLVTGSVIAALAVALIAYSYLHLRVADEIDKITVEEAHHVQLQAVVLSSDLRYISYTLSFLRDQIQDHGLVETDQDRVHFALDMYSFMHNNDLFDQIRFIDATGMERLRVDAGQGEPFVVPDQDLQFKGDTYYFRQSMALNSREIYISALDLNIEHGKVERPFKPVIRFGLKVLHPDGKPGGVLMINHKAQDMLDRFALVSSPSASKPMLLNRNGYWLSHPDTDKEWGFMFPAGASVTMAKSNPALWARVQHGDNDQFNYQGDLISYATVYPFKIFTSLSHFKINDHTAAATWKVMSIFPARAIEAVIAPVKNRVVLGALLIWLLISLMLSLLLRGWQQKQVNQAQMAIRNQAIEDSTNGIFICDVRQPDEPIIYCNAAFESITGYARNEILGRNFSFMQENDRDQDAVAALKDAIADRRSYQLTLKNYRKDGSFSWSQISTSPVFSRDGSISHYLAYVMDVSERKQSESERVQLLKQVQTLSRELMQARELERAEIARTMHDEFGQILTAIQIQAELSDQQCQSHDYDAALESIHKLELFADQLMNSTRTVLKQLQPGHLQKLGLFEAVRELCDEWRRSAGIDIDVSLHGEMSELAEQINIHLYRIVQEGITNIVRHSGATHADIDFRFKVNRVKLTIQDNGCGFDIHQITIGNGLTSMRERARLLGGNLEVSIPPEGGSMLVFRIPASKLKQNP